MLQIGIRCLFGSDGGSGAVAGEDLGIVGKWPQFLVDSVDELLMVSVWKICSADAAVEQHISGNDDRISRKAKTHAVWRVTGNVEQLEFVPVEL